MRSMFEICKATNLHRDTIIRHFFDRLTTVYRKRGYFATDADFDYIVAHKDSYKSYKMSEAQRERARERQRDYDGKRRTKRNQYFSDIEGVDSVADREFKEYYENWKKEFPNRYKKNCEALGYEY